MPFIVLAALFGGVMCGDIPTTVGGVHWLRGGNLLLLFLARPLLRSVLGCIGWGIRLALIYLFMRTFARMIRRRA
jgi:hypothetical protein